MEKKLVKDTTKEDHFIEVVAGLKIIYNQNQYLAFIEKPKKKRDIRLEIYIGKLSHVRDQYLIFKCETDSEKQQVFSLFKDVFSEKENSEIELIDYSTIDRISIVSFNEFPEKQEAYPNLFTLPEKEEIDANLNFSNFFMKKKPVEETEIVTPQASLEHNAPIPEPKVETSIMQNEKTVEETKQEIQIDQSPANLEPQIISSEENKEVINETNSEAQIENKMAEDIEIPIIPLETSGEIIGEKQEDKEILDIDIEIPIIPLETSGEIIGENNNNIQPETNIETPIVSPEENKEIVEETNKEIQPETNIETPIAPLEENKEIVEETNKEVQPETSIGTPIEPIQNKEEQMSSKLTNLEPIPPVPMKKPKKGKGSKIIIIIMVIILLIAGIISLYLFVIEPNLNKTPKKTNKPATAVNEKMVCTFSDKNQGSLTDTTVTITYNKKTHNILTERLEGKATFENVNDYNQMKQLLQSLSQTNKNTDGKSQTYNFQDAVFSYTVIEERDHRKAKEEEKDNTWYATIDEAKGYYLNEGYTCDGEKKEIEVPKEKEISLQSKTGNSEVNYNNWNVKFINATIYDDQQTMMITLQITNKGTSTRTMKGNFELYDSTGKVIGNAVLDNEVDTDSPLTYMFSISGSETTNLSAATSYRIKINQ